MNEVVSGFPHTRKLKWINDLDVKSKTVKFYESTEMGLYMSSDLAMSSQQGPKT